MVYLKLRYQALLASIYNILNGSSEITGKIDYSNELKLKIHLVNANGNTYINNLSDKVKIAHKKYIPNIWLGN